MHWQQELLLGSVVLLISPVQFKNTVKSNPPLHPQVQPCFSFSFVLSFTEKLKLLSTREVKNNFFWPLTSDPSLCFSISLTQRRKTFSPDTVQRSPPHCCPVLWCEADARCHQEELQGVQGLALAQEAQGTTATRPSTKLQQFTRSPVVLPTWASKVFHSFSLVQWRDPCFLQSLSIFSPRHFCAGLPPHHVPLDSPALMDKMHNRQHVLKGLCYTPSPFWFYTLISVFWIKGRRVVSLRFLAIFSACIRETVMPMIFHALAEHGCSRQELYFLNKKGR